MAAIIALALAGAGFAWIVAPLLGEHALISQERPEGSLKNAVAKSIQELKTDLQLNKIQEEDLQSIEEFLEKTAREP